MGLRRGWGRVLIWFKRFEKSVCGGVERWVKSLFSFTRKLKTLYFLFFVTKVITFWGMLSRMHVFLFLPRNWDGDTRLLEDRRIIEMKRDE